MTDDFDITNEEKFTTMVVSRMSLSAFLKKLRTDQNLDIKDIKFPAEELSQFENVGVPIDRKDQLLNLLGIYKTSETDTELTLKKFRKEDLKVIRDTGQSIKELKKFEVELKPNLIPELINSEASREFTLASREIAYVSLGLSPDNAEKVSFGEALKILRQKSEVSLRTAAKACSISNSLISAWEQDVIPGNEDTLKKLLKSYKATTEEKELLLYIRKKELGYDFNINHESPLKTIIANLRIDENVSQSKAGTRAGLIQATIGAWETGTHPKNLDIFLKYIKTFEPSKNTIELIKYRWVKEYFEDGRLSSNKEKPKVLAESNIKTATALKEKFEKALSQIGLAA